VVSVRRADGAVVLASDAMRLSGGDTLVLSGVPEALTIAEEKLLRG
jgi:monovalent cation:H+ antiporter-2, CPA2 family